MEILLALLQKDISKFLYEHAPDRKRLIEISVKELIQNRMD